MLTVEQIENNKISFLKLLSEIDVEGADTQGLADFLISSDFFSAPASTIYHCNYEGGLCQHTLNVYKNLMFLVDHYAPGRYSNNSILIVSLFHDISKANYYEKYTMNKKIYSENGTKHDNMGKFSWFAEEAYKVKDVKDRFIGGEHGFNSMMIINSYIPMTYEESIAILNHHCGMGEANQLRDLSAVLNNYSLVTFLHAADFLATFIDERSL